MTNLRYCYQTVEFGKTDIHLCTLRDNQQFHDPEGTAEALGIFSAHWPLFGVIWPSSMVLAHFMYDHPIDTQRTLEIGCGIALSSLLLNKQDLDITATDHHPEAGKFLLRNTQLNQDKPIAYQRADWFESNDSLGLFDLIIGSDLLYEDEHIDLLADFINAHAEPRCEVILVDPGRGRKSKLSTRMIGFGFSSTHHKPSQTDYLEKEFKGHILHFKR